MYSYFLIFLGIIIILFILEISLRVTIGFHNPLLYIADPEIGYLLAPNQQVRRFQNRVVINEYSMRSPNLLNPKQGLRVLLLGDSVLNGSWWTDQADTISEMIKRLLVLEQRPPNSLFKGDLNSPPFLRGAKGDHPALNYQPPSLQTPERKPPNPLEKGAVNIEILNVSANGWSPRNELAYLQKFGVFQADILVLLLNTDDLFGTAPTSIPVGSDCGNRSYDRGNRSSDRGNRNSDRGNRSSDRYYPSQKPTLAIFEAATRLLIPYTPPPEMAVVNAEGGDRVGFNLAALATIYQISQTEKLQIIIALTPLWHEVSGQPKDYEILARERLGKFMQDRNITYLDFLPIFQNHPFPKTLYRDQIHLQPLGNQIVSTEISKIIVGQTPHANLEDKF